MRRAIRAIEFTVVFSGIASWSVAKSGVEEAAVAGARLISAKLVTGTALNVASEVSGGVLDGTATTNSPTAYLRWETQRLGSLGPRQQPAKGGFVPSLNLEGGFGFTDALTAIRDSDAGEAAEADSASDAETRFKKAFAWDLGGRLSYRLRQTELAGVVRGGQTILLSDEDLVNTTSGLRIVVPADNGVQNAAWFGELGLSLRLYNPPDPIAAIRAADDPGDDPNPVRTATNRGAALTQALELAAGYRYDDRFNKDGDLASLESPEKRWFARFMLNGRQLLNTVRGETAPVDQVYDFSFGVEYERGYGSGGAKGGTRILIDGGTDLIKLLKK